MIFRSNGGMGYALHDDFQSARTLGNYHLRWITQIGQEDGMHKRDALRRPSWTLNASLPGSFFID